MISTNIVCDETRSGAHDSNLNNSYTMGCPPVRGDNPRALASGLSYVQVDKHGITILYHLHQCRPSTSRDQSVMFEIKSGRRSLIVSSSLWTSLNNDIRM